jgi:hypothetical protein
LRALVVPTLFLALFAGMDVWRFREFCVEDWSTYRGEDGPARFLWSREAPRLKKALEVIPEDERVLFIARRGFGDWKSNYYLYPRRSEIVPLEIADHPRQLKERYGSGWIFYGPNLFRLRDGELELLATNRP